MTDFPDPHGDYRLYDNDPRFINRGEWGSSGISYTSSDNMQGAIIGQPIQPGYHLKIIMANAGLPRTDTYGIAVRVYPKAVKYLWQDGTFDIALRNDWRLQFAVYPYSIGDEVWYNVFNTTPSSGVLTAMDGQLPNVDNVTITDATTGQEVVTPFTNFIIKMDVPGKKVNYTSAYNQ